MPVLRQAAPLCASLFGHCTKLTVIKQFEILDALPAYGPMYIPVSESSEAFYSEGFVVRFYKTDGSDWVANFKLGWTRLKGIYELKAIPALLVIAGGMCYLMNPDDIKPISVFGIGYRAVLHTQDGRIVLSNDIDLTIVETNGDHWQTDRIAWDGLKDLKVEGGIVSGLSYDPMDHADEWPTFAFDLDNKTLTGGSFNKYKLTRKPWWKLW